MLYLIFPEIGLEEKLIDLGLLAPTAPQPAGNGICDNWSARASRDTEFGCCCTTGYQQPIHLDPDRYERVILGTEFLRPYASEALVAKGGASLPGRASHPMPLLMYSPGVYFARLVDLIQQNAPARG
ncbi:hypothetical protein V1279_000554 [Bradyrhizobium sp. AZCC 1610]|uniref:hypothetical protein n=1 Tax=Bradyrhizobium sp. AZCC 1610 TaxID=3117020 RepID=UPI002FF376E2